MFGSLPNASLPELMTDHDDARRVGPIVFHRDRAAEQRPDAEQREELRRHELRVQPRGLAGAGQRDGAERQAASRLSVRLSRCQSSQLAGETTWRVRPMARLAKPEIR